MDARPVAFITGIAGQDGSYLAELLLTLGYTVHGLVRKASRGCPANLAHLSGPLHLWPGDILDQARLTQLLYQLRPHEIYHLAAMSHVAQCQAHPQQAAETNTLGTLRLLDAVRQATPRARFFFASSSELFGNPATSPQDENTPFQPRNFYGSAKLLAHQAVVQAREQHGLFACCGILFNHESPRRHPHFVTRRVCEGVARIVRGETESLTLGNLQALRDWSYAGDIVKAMWCMLQRDAAEDYVLGSGVLHSVEELVTTAFASADLNWIDWVECEADLVRLESSVPLCAEADKARRHLGWRASLTFQELVQLMVEAELAMNSTERNLILSMPSRDLAKSA
jgi:GDPmannose 4,6-dehydratase